MLKQDRIFSVLKSGRTDSYGEIQMKKGEGLTELHERLCDLMDEKGVRKFSSKIVSNNTTSIILIYEGV